MFGVLFSKGVVFLFFSAWVCNYRGFINYFPVALCEGFVFQDEGYPAFVLRDCPNISLGWL